MADRYQSPLVERYASAEMLELWSATTRHGLWRRLWVALAAAQSGLGLPISAAQVEELRRAADAPIDYELVRQRERETRHDVMAHLHAFGVAAPGARGVVHLGATSCFVTDNADLVLMREALRLVASRLATCVRRLAAFAREHRARATLGSTHLQPAQPTTVGKRACVWIQDLLIALEEVDRRAADLRLRGVKGTTGTQDSYLKLLGDPEQVRELERQVAAAFDFDEVYPVTGQTYPRIVDSQVLGALALVAQAAARLAGDVRILARDREIEEPFESTQVGSSAMAYKRNPMRCERVSALSRHLIQLAGNAPATASAQFLERTLDDSANRRLAIPESFLAADAILRLVANVAGGLVVHPRVIERRLAAEAPFLATEAILMAAAAAGGDRQELHERIRVHSGAAAERMKEGDGENDLLERLAADPAFAGVRDRLTDLADPAKLTGLAPEQVDAFLAGPVVAALARHPEEEADGGGIEV